MREGLQDAANSICRASKETGAKGHSSILDCNEEKSDMTYAFNQFCVDCRAVLKQTPGEAAHEEVG